MNSIPILHVLDLFSKFVVINRVKSKEPWDVLTMFIASWVRYFGVPQRIITDMGKEFDNKVFRFVGERLGIKLDVTPSGAHWCLGQVEAKHENLRRMIEQALKENPSRQSEEAIDSTMMAHNATPGSTGISPSQIQYGKTINLPNALDDSPTRMGSMCPDDLPEQHLRFVERLQHEMVDSQRRYWQQDALVRLQRAENLDTRRGDHVQPGDEVLVWREPSRKGQFGWRGPCKLMASDDDLIVVKWAASVLRLHPFRVKKIKYSTGHAKVDSMEGGHMTLRSENMAPIEEVVIDEARNEEVTTPNLPRDLRYLYDDDGEEEAHLSLLSYSITQLKGLRDQLVCLQLSHEKQVNVRYEAKHQELKQWDTLGVCDVVKGEPHHHVIKGR